MAVTLQVHTKTAASVGAIAAALIAVGLWIVGALPFALRISAGPSGFPPFFVIQETVTDGNNRMVTRLEYRSPTDWIEYAVEDSEDPSNAGSYQRAAGDDLVVYSARTDSTDRYQGRGRWVPGPWLLSPSELLRLPGEVVVDRLSAGKRTLAVERTISCEDEDGPQPMSGPDERPSAGSAATLPPGCAKAEGSYTYRTEYVFDAASGVPLRIEKTADGVQVELRRVLEFELR